MQRMALLLLALLLLPTGAFASSNWSVWAGSDAGFGVEGSMYGVRLSVANRDYEDTATTYKVQTTLDATYGLQTKYVRLEAGIRRSDWNRCLTSNNNHIEGDASWTLLGKATIEGSLLGLDATGMVAIVRPELEYVATLGKTFALSDAAVPSAMRLFVGYRQGGWHEGAVLGATVTF